MVLPFFSPVRYVIQVLTEQLAYIVDIVRLDSIRDQAKLLSHLPDHSFIIYCEQFDCYNIYSKVCSSGGSLVAL